MKKNFLFSAILMIAVSSCGNKTAEAPEAPVQDSTEQVVDTTAVQQPADTVVAEAVEEAPAIEIKKGIYKVTKRVVVRTAPGESSGKMKSAFGGGAMSLSSGDWVEATGTVENGFAKVKEHLIEDQSACLWDKQYGWVPVDCLKPAKCNHQHLFADGLI